MCIDEVNNLAQDASSAHRVPWTVIKEINKQNAARISRDSVSKLTKFSSVSVDRFVVSLRDQQWGEVFKMGLPMSTASIRTVCGGNMQVAAGLYSMLMRLWMLMSRMVSQRLI